LYGITFSVLTALRPYALSAFAYDLGIYNQSLYTTVTYHRLFYYTADLPANPSGNIFGVHFSPLLIVLLVPYSLVPSILTLTTIQTWAIALAAVPIYLLAKAMLKSGRNAFLLALIFLLHPATQGVNWYDFHPEAFLLLFLGAALYFLEVRLWRRFLAAIILSLTTIEMAALIVAAVAVGALLSSWWRARRRGVAMSREEFRVLLGTFVLAIGWFVVAAVVIIATNPRNIFVSGGSEFWTILGASGPLTVPVSALIRPDLAAAAVSYDGLLKLWYVIVLFGPVLFLTFRSPRAVFYCLPWLGVSLLSNQVFPAYYVVGNQYPAFVLPFIFYGAILGLRCPPIGLAGRIRRRLGITAKHEAEFLRSPEFAHPSKATPVAMLAVVIALLLASFPFGPWAFGGYNVGGFPVIGDHERAVLALYGFIPPEASVLTQNNLFPLLSNRLQAFVVPINSFFPPGESFNETMGAWIASMDYILIDYKSSMVEASVILAWPGVAEQYYVEAAADGALLLRRGQGAPVWYQPLVRSVHGSGVIPINASIMDDPQATGGRALRFALTSSSDFWWGPYLFLPPGAYTVSYRLRADRIANGTVLRLPAYVHPLELVVRELGSATTGTHLYFSLNQLPIKYLLTERDLWSTDFPESGTYVMISFDFEARTLGAYEFPGLAAEGSVGLWLDSILVEQRVPYESANLQLIWYPPSGGA